MKINSSVIWLQMGRMAKTMRSFQLLEERRLARDLSSNMARSRITRMSILQIFALARQGCLDVFLLEHNLLGRKPMEEDNTSNLKHILLTMTYHTKGEYCTFRGYLQTISIHYSKASYVFVITINANEKVSRIQGFFFLSIWRLRKILVPFQHV